MERIICSPRAAYKKKVEEIGFGYHEDYWLEDAYYRFSKQEIQEIEAATNACYQMYCDAVEVCLYDEAKLDALQIPQEVRSAIRRSWEEDDLSLYGRFDFAYVNGVPKLLEFNADTPTTLVEAAIVQWHWKEELFPAADQFNLIHENLVASWKEIYERYHLDRIYFGAFMDCMEDMTTMEYLAAAALQAGVEIHQMDIRDVEYCDGSLYAPDGRPIECMFKLYPLENMFKDDMLACMTEMCWIEPLWKALMSNKAMLPILYEMFPDSPYLLPAYADSPRNMRSYCKKPIFSREGCNIELVKYGAVIESTSGDYGQEGYIYQQLADFAPIRGYYPILGCWVVGGVASGMGIRESTSRITQDQSHFAPHIFV